ncbi:MAG TPA: hypothetical protein VGH49_08445 [Xanthobacteraceae bacterium]|jgi:hypothetical protein
MQNPAEFRNFADECKRLAEHNPELRESLLKMAEAWTALADETENAHDEAP